MNARISTFGLLILSLFVCNNIVAQKASYSSNSGLFLGLGGGKTYQKSDIAYSSGLGFDFTLGSKLYYREQAFLSVDWKFRFLAGENKSYDLSINTDNSISNVCYRFYSYDLELGLTLNRLRERTRIVLSGFAGLGITHGLTSTDLYDAESNLYDYSSIDLNRDRKMVYKDLLALSDGNYETALLNRAAILPTAGLFIGYQVSRSLTVGFEFKTNFYLTEKNSLLGLDLDNRVLEGSSLDRNSYISAGFTWTLRGRSSRTPRYDSYTGGDLVNAPAQKAEVVPVNAAHPTVYITDPGAESFYTASGTHTLWALVNHVDGPDNISFHQNGFPNHSFSYNEGTNIFIANVDLREGENQFRIQATNQASSAEDQVTIIREHPSETYIPPTEVEISDPGNAENLPVMYPGNHPNLPFPSIRFIRPATRMQVENNFFPLSAAIQHVPGRDHITLQLNGARVPNFSYKANGNLTATLLLSEGINTIDITAANEAGMAHESTSISYVKPVYHLPVYKGPLIQQPVRNAPVIHEPVRNEPVVHEPVARERIAREPVTRRPGSRVPVVTDPVASEPVKSQPVLSKPILSKPILSEPGRSKPINRDPASGERASRKPALRIPVKSTDPPAKEKSSEIRINPGNADWQFCMITPSGSFSRENLTNSNFSYSGSASSLYIQPTGGGGDALVNGSPYPIKSGQYYLFTGSLKVRISTKHPGSMGHWAVTVEADRAPVAGNGNSRPKSPCETEKKNAGKGPKSRN